MKKYTKIQQGSSSFAISNLRSSVQNIATFHRHKLVASFGLGGGVVVVADWCRWVQRRAPGPASSCITYVLLSKWQKQWRQSHMTQSHNFTPVPPFISLQRQPQTALPLCPKKERQFLAETCQASEVYRSTQYISHAIKLERLPGIPTDSQAFKQRTYLTGFKKYNI